MLRGLADDVPEFRKRLITWIMLCDQWPFRAALIIAALDHSFFLRQQTGKVIFGDNVPLWRMYDEHLKWFVHDLIKKVPTEKKDLRRRHQKLVSLDGDATQFEYLLRREPVGRVIIE